MPRLKFDFSEPVPIYDPLSKDLSVQDYHLSSGTSYFADNHELRLDVFGNSREAVVQFTDQFNSDDENTEWQESKSEFVIKRTEPSDNIAKEEDLGETNMLVNIYFEPGSNAEPVVITLDIDPPITIDTRHIYTFSSTKSSDIILNIEAKDGRVEGEIKCGAQNIISALDPLLPVQRDEAFTADKRADSMGSLKRFLDPDTMKSRLDQLTPELAPEVADKSSEEKKIVKMTIKKTDEKELIHFALIVTGRGNGLNKYRLFGRINRAADS